MPSQIYVMFLIFSSLIFLGYFSYFLPFKFFYFCYPPFFNSLLYIFLSIFRFLFFNFFAFFWFLSSHFFSFIIFFYLSSTFSFSHPFFLKAFPFWLLFFFSQAFFKNIFRNFHYFLLQAYLFLPSSSLILSFYCYYLFTFLQFRELILI